MNDETLARICTDRASESEVAEFMAWRRLSRENERRFQAVATLLANASEADGARKPGAAPSAAQIVAAADRALSSEGQPVQPSTVPSHDASHRNRMSWARATVAAAAVILVALGIAQVQSSRVTPAAYGAREFVTGPSDQATVVLTDGTVVRLAADSRLMVLEGTSDREVSLVGRGYFAVAPDSSRPFIVRSNAGEVRVLGTRFSLDASTEDLRLVVVEGSVALTGEGDVEATQVGASQMARLVRGTLLPVVEVPDPALLADLGGTFLAFQNTPLRTAADEIAREYDVQIEITDPRLASRTITAWFVDWSLPDVMEIVCIVADARCELTESLVTIDSPTGPSNSR